MLFEWLTNDFSYILKETQNILDVEFVLCQFFLLVPRPRLIMLWKGRHRWYMVFNYGVFMWIKRMVMMHDGWNNACEVIRIFVSYAFFKEKDKIIR